MTTTILQIPTRAQLLRGIRNYTRWKKNVYKRVEPDGPEDGKAAAGGAADLEAVSCEAQPPSLPVTRPVAQPLDWTVYARFKSEGRINLLLRLSDPLAMKVSGVLRPGDTPPSKIILFVSRGEQLLWRKNWTRGRFVRLSWPPDQRAALIRQDATFRDADAAWEKRHGRASGVADVLEFVASTAPRLKW